MTTLDTNFNTITVIDPSTVETKQHFHNGQMAVTYQTLICDSITNSQGLVAGIAISKPGDYQPTRGHTHQEPEIYFIISGNAKIVTETGDIYAPQGSVVYIPGGVEHAAMAETPDSEMTLFYVFGNISCFNDIIYNYHPE